MIIKSPLVVGYKGEIGSFILQGLLRLLPKALQIYCIDINETEEERKERIAKADFIFLCVPMDETNNFLSKYAYALKGKTVIEQTSLKYPLYEDKRLMKRLEHIKIMPMHILFRPSSTPNIRAERTVALIGHEWKDLALEIEEITNARIVRYRDYLAHDIDMAFQQALLHRLILVTEGVCNTTHYNGTYVLRQVIGLADRIKSGDRRLYEIIQHNKHLKTAMKRFKREFGNFEINRYFK